MKPKLTDICIADIKERLGRQPKILIVDDEESITEVLGFAFSTVGYDVATLQCTNTARKHIVEGNGHYDVVVSDYDNKDASGDYEGGMTLYRRLQREGVVPSLYVVISSYDTLPIPEEVPFMRKPLGMYDLAHLVTTELRGRISPAVEYTPSAAPQAK